MERNGTKGNEREHKGTEQKRNGTKRNRTNRNGTKRNETKQCANLSTVKCTSLSKTNTSGRSGQE